MLQRFYNSGCCTEPSDAEKRHQSRFHKSPGSRNIPSAPDRRVSWSSAVYCRSPPEGTVGNFSRLSRLHVLTKKEGVSLKSKSLCWQNLSSPDEDVDMDVDIRVAPGTYAITASVADSEQQTVLVSLKAGESFKVQFNF